MGFSKQIKDLFYNLLLEPTKEKFRVFLENQTGEHNTIDYKKEWIKGSSLAKEMISIANYGGGVIIVGVKERDDNSLASDGIEALVDKTEVANSIHKYVPTDLQYEIYDFSYDTSEYKELEGKRFQLLVIEDSPSAIPFLALRDGEDIKTNMIYIRRGASCAVASREEIAQIINRRINYTYPTTGAPLSLGEHLKQLKSLYGFIEKTKVSYRFKKGSELETAIKSFGEAMPRLFDIVDTEKNPLFPPETFDEYIARMIVEKKKKIERVLDIY